MKKFHAPTKCANEG